MDRLATYDRDNAGIWTADADRRVGAAPVIEMFRLAPLHVFRMAGRTWRIVAGQSPEGGASLKAFDLLAFVSLAYASHEVSDRLIGDLFDAPNGWHLRPTIRASWPPVKGATSSKRAF